MMTVYEARGFDARGNKFQEKVRVPVPVPVLCDICHCPTTHTRSRVCSGCRAGIKVTEVVEIVEEEVLLPACRGVGCNNFTPNGLCTGCTLRKAAKKADKKAARRGARMVRRRGAVILRAPCKNKCGNDTRYDVCSGCLQAELSKLCELICGCWQDDHRDRLPCGLHKCEKRKEAKAIIEKLKARGYDMSGYKIAY